MRHRVTIQLIVETKVINAVAVNKAIHATLIHGTPIEAFLEALPGVDKIRVSAVSTKPEGGAT